MPPQWYHHWLASYRVVDDSALQIKDVAYHLLDNVFIQHA